MKENKALNITLTIIRIFVGVLFIFSGLIKANDPSGLAYKMGEFFEVWAKEVAGAPANDNNKTLVEYVSGLANSRVA